MSKIYFRRQATVPPEGTNGIAIFCTSNETLYLDGVPYGNGSLKGAVTALTQETWWGGKSEIVIEDGQANIDLTEMAKQSDVKRLLDDVFVIKNELELSGPLNPSGDPRSAIDILNEDITKVNKDLQLTKGVVSANTSNISANTTAINNMQVDISAVSANTLTNAKNIALEDDRIGKLESRERDLTYSAETMQTYEQEMKNMIIDIDDTYVSAITFNGSKEFKPFHKVVNITAKTYDAEIADLSAVTTAQTQLIGKLSGAVSATNDNLNTLSGEVIDFEEQVGDDIENISGAITSMSGAVDSKISGLSADTAKKLSYVSGKVDTMISGVSVNGVEVPVSGNVSKLNNISINIKDRKIVLGDITGGVQSALLPSDNYISAGSYDAKSKNLIFKMTDGTEVKVNASGLVDVYTADENTITLSGNKFSIATAITKQINDNTDGLYELYDTIGVVSGKVNNIDANYLSGAVFNSVTGTVKNHIVSLSADIKQGTVQSVSLNNKNYTPNASGIVNLGTIDLSSTLSGASIQSGTSATVAVSNRNAKITLVPINIYYDKTTGNLNLSDEFGVATSAVHLDLERFVTSGEYVEKDKAIYLYFSSAKTDNVKIPVSAITDLVKQYTADEKSLHLSGTQFSLISSAQTRLQNSLTGVSYNNSTASVTNNVAQISGIIPTYSADEVTINKNNNTFSLASSAKTRLNNSLTGISYNNSSASVTNNVAKISGLVQSVTINSTNYKPNASGLVSISGIEQTANKVTVFDNTTKVSNDDYPTSKLVWDTISNQKLTLASQCANYCSFGTPKDVVFGIITNSGNTAFSSYNYETVLGTGTTIPAEGFRYNSMFSMYYDSVDYGIYRLQATTRGIADGSIYANIIALSNDALTFFTPFVKYNSGMTVAYYGIHWSGPTVSEFQTKMKEVYGYVNPSITSTTGMKIMLLQEELEYGRLLRVCKLNSATTTPIETYSAITPMDTIIDGNYINNNIKDVQDESGNSLVNTDRIAVVESPSNKVSAITTDNSSSLSGYTSIKSVVDYVDSQKGQLKATCIHGTSLSKFIKVVPTSTNTPYYRITAMVQGGSQNADFYGMFELSFGYNRPNNYCFAKWIAYDEGTNRPNVTHCPQISVYVKNDNSSLVIAGKCPDASWQWCNLFIMTDNGNDTNNDVTYYNPKSDSDTSNYFTEVADYTEVEIGSLVPFATTESGNTYLNIYNQTTNSFDKIKIG